MMEMIGASPQKENGYVAIANEITEALAKINLRPYEWRTLWVIFRKTYGWQKKEDKVSVSQFQVLTGLDRRHQRKAIKTLFEKNIIFKGKDSYVKQYGFQKDYTQWKLLPKQAIDTPPKTIADLSNRVLLKQAIKLLPKQADTKDNKETIQKKGVPTYLQEVIKVYKGLKGYDAQQDWDKLHYKRHVAPAKRLYEAANNDWFQAMEWVSKQGYSDWTLETVFNKLPDYKKTAQRNPLGAAGRVLNG
jgi:phage replication O-like protein O